MTKFSILTILTMIVFAIIYHQIISRDMHNPLTNEKQKSKDMFYFYCLIALALFVRILAAVSYYGHDTDMNCFFAWSGMVYENGFGQFYSSETFTDYPPGYMYILYIIGWIRSVTGMDGTSGMALLLMKLPAILCDLAIGFLIHKVATKRFSEWGSLLLTAMFLLNPIIILDSSTWGQVDSVFTLFVIGTIYLLTRKKRIPAYFVFAIAILIKPQSLIFTPVLIFAIIEQVFLHDFSWKKFWTDLLSGLAAIGSLFLFMLPFGIGKVLNQYIDTMASYEYASVNAYNLWALFGKNWRPQEDAFLFLTYNQWGTLFIVLTVLFSAFLFFKAKKDESKYYFTPAVIVIGMYFMSVRMHERYMFPAIPLLLMAFLAKPRLEKFIVFSLFTAAGFLNMTHVLFYYDPPNYNWENPIIFWISLFTLVSFGTVCYVAYKHYLVKQIPEEHFVKNQKDKAKQTKQKKKEPVIFQISETGQKWVKFDFLAITLITVVYAIIAFYDLGEAKAPKTIWESETVGEQIVLDLGESSFLKEMLFFLGNYEGRKYNLEVSESKDYGWESILKENYLEDMEDEDKENNVEPYMKLPSVFCWNKLDINRMARYVRITFKSDRTALFEIAIKDKEDHTVLPVNTTGFENLFDEQDLVPERVSFRNSTYFDEIYHARTAYEYIHGLYSYENTHPPLGKGFIALGVLMFGMNPFGWRFMGTLFGVLMIPIFYLFAKRLLKESWLAAVTTILFTFDFMHFAQTRIATIDVFVTLFVILMYYFMYRYAKLSFYDTEFKKTLIPLGLSGIFMGFGVASKWTGAYAGVGLAVIFFLILYRRYREYQYAVKRPTEQSGNIDHHFVITHYHKYVKHTILFCVLFFVIIPAVIYALSYLPFSDGTDKGWLAQMIRNQNTMYNYHSNLDATHSFSSLWYEWPIMTRPMWFYSGQVSDTLKEGISSFGNPLVWWVGIPAFFYMVYLIIKKKDRNALFLSISYLAQYLPWFLVTRVVFIYHYFPSVPFVTLMIGYSMYRIYQYKPKLKYAIFIYVGLACVLFVLFYPVLAGQPVHVDFAKQFLKWFDSWVLIPS